MPLLLDRGARHELDETVRRLLLGLRFVVENPERIATDDRSTAIRKRASGNRCRPKLKWSFFKHFEDIAGRGDQHRRSAGDEILLCRIPAAADVGKDTVLN